MRSRAHLKTHPLHPILVGFPIAFFTAAFIFDLVALLSKNSAQHITAGHLLMAGLGTAVLAAIPGLVDYLYVVPPDSSAKNRASIHAFLNVCMLILFATALIYRLTTHYAEPMVFLLLEGGAVIIMFTAGWMGGTLVHRNQIGIDHRYAFAGKWREVVVEPEQGRAKLGVVEELKRDQMILVHVAGKRIVVGRTEQGFVAFDDRCPHKGGSLAGGIMMCHTVQCPWHGSQFDVNDGVVKAGPASRNISTYQTEIINHVLYLNLAAPG